MIFFKKTIYFLIIIFLLTISGSQIIATVSAIPALAASLIDPNKPVEQLDISQAKIQQKYQKAEEIKPDYKMQKASFVKEAKDENAIQMEVGNKNLDNFEPSLTLRKWNDEVNFVVKYKHNEKEKDQKVDIENKKIKWKGKKTEVHFYEMKKGEILIGKELENDVFEVEVLLLEKPDTNTVEFDTETEGLNFYYQPELTQKEKDEGVFRPENVIGSYAVYHESKAGDYSKMGGKNYMTGKAFHIYRPKIIDSVGTEVWGELNINIENKLLTVEIPQEFLDNAVYPVRHAAGLTFGETGIGGSYTYLAKDRMYGYIASPTDGDGDVDDIKVYIGDPFSFGSDYIKGVLVLSSSKGIVSNGVGSVAYHSDGAGYAWRTSSYSTKPSVVNNTPYIISFISQIGNSAYKFDVITDAGWYDSSNNYSTPTSPTDGGLLSQRISIYATYTAIPEYSAMASDNYTIQSDSINFGGGRASSTSYVMEDTLGEIATGVSTSSSYDLHAGYQQMYETYLSMTSAADVTLTPAIGGVTGGTANGSTAVTVTTDSVAGYELSIKASSSPALSSMLDDFTDYTTASAGVPDYTFTIVATSSEFGFSPEGDDIYSKYKDNGSACNTGSGDTSDKCWESLSTTNELIAKSTTANHPNGIQTTIKFRAQSGSSHIQIAGDYTATTTITAIAL